MAGKISELTAATAYNNTDEVELLQSNNNLRLTKGVLRKLLYGTASDGNRPRYDSAAANVDTVSGGTGDWVLDDSTGYRAINTGRYNGAISTDSTIAMSVTSDVAQGLPVRYVVSGNTRYGIITTVTSNTSIVVAGPSLSSGATVSSLAVGPAEKVEQIWLPMNASESSTTPGNNYSTAASTTHLATYGMTYRKWMGPIAYCVTFSATHRTKTSTTAAKMNLLVNSARVSTSDSNNGIQLGAAGTWVDNTPLNINTSNYDINYGESIEVEITVASASGSPDDDLVVVAVFVKA